MFNLVFCFILCWKLIAFYDKISFMLDFFIHIFRKIKFKTKNLGSISTITHDYNDLIKLLQNVLVILLCWCKRYIIWVFNLHELFLPFSCANNIGSLLNNLFGVKVFNPAASFFLSREFNFNILATVSSGSNFTSSPSSSGLSHLHPHLYLNQKACFQTHFELLSFPS